MEQIAGFRECGENALPNDHFRYSVSELKRAISCVVTQKVDYTLLWIVQTRCHPMCSIMPGMCSCPWDLKKIVPRMMAKHDAILRRLLGKENALENLSCKIALRNTKSTGKVIETP